MKNRFKYLYEREEKRNIERELFKRKYNSLSLVERNAYEQIIERHSGGENTWAFMKLVPWTIVYIGIFGLILKFFLQVDIIEPLKNVVIILFQLWIPFILLGVLFDFIDANKLDKLKKRLLKI